jgi:hypothetical protein
VALGKFSAMGLTPLVNGLVDEAATQLPTLPVSLRYSSKSRVFTVFFAAVLAVGMIFSPTLKHSGI